jgi:CRISPR/Cas system CSM-associated protein Csm3 (group 7 of RAMP superfamily)
MSECRRKVIHHKKKATDTIPDPMEDTNKIFNCHGFDENSIDRVTLQAKIDELMKPLKAAEYTDTTIFEINEECKAKFVDKKGSKTNRVYLGKEETNGTMWIYFWLMGKNVKPENLTDATLQRDKKRSKAERALEEMHSQFSKQMQAAQQEKANMAKQMEQMQAQLALLLNNNSSSDAPMADDATSGFSEDY